MASLNYNFDPTNPVNLYAIWSKNSTDSQYFIKVNGTWRTGSIFLKQGIWL